MARHPDTIITPNTLLIKAREQLPSPQRPEQPMSRAELADVINSALTQLYPGRDLSAFSISLTPTPSEPSSTEKATPSEVVTDANPVYPRVLDDLVPSAWHHVERHANNPIETDHSQLTHRLRPMRGLHTDRTAQTIITGHAPSCRTSDADTTNSDPTSRPRYVQPPPSPN
ncbi:transposase [Micromonospora sp. NBC_01655]|uniref:DDE-type integrase/transposase/recombinase n=1 Tax=Micromonospora sp. NBC_01655 TaxID=2975983 RepID=UPI002255A100|nr:DDE-type integrase/transposase/recombinase [Micromonospora sp. NBC_01655]MCX4471413.1 transposase [Micromonospora sp. NBC_01655]